MFSEGFSAAGAGPQTRSPAWVEETVLPGNSMSLMARMYGRCRRGEWLHIGFPLGQRKTTTLVPGLRMTSMGAPMVLDGPIHGD